MEILIVTGLSGAGKSKAINTLEDIGFFCIDNMPADFIKSFLISCSERGYKGRFAIVVDMRSHSYSSDLVKSKEELAKIGYNVKILFLDASDSVILHRYKETRRRHPLLEEGAEGLEDAIARERTLLMANKKNADYVIDTDLLDGAQLREKVVAIFSDKADSMPVSVVSFGFKYGAPKDADLVFDVRCLANPHYVDSLRPLTGCEKAVSDYVFANDEANILLEKYIDLLKFSLPLYKKEGKSNVTVAIGCTGGKHRSVAFAEKIGNALKEEHKMVLILHRDYKR